MKCAFGMPEATVPPRDDARCRCWSTTTQELQSCLGVAIEHLDLRQLQRFVRIWHEVDQRYGPNRRAEANAALADSVRVLLGEESVRLAGGGAVDQVAGGHQTIALSAEVR
jgi:hypothetical protein